MKKLLALFLVVLLAVAGAGCSKKKKGNGVDVTPPPVPQNAEAVAVSPTAIRITWDAVSANDLDHYNVYEGAVKIGETDEATYTHTGLAPGSTHTYSVSSVDTTGNISARSNSTAATTPTEADNEAPSIPGNFTANAATANLVNLSWTASTDNVGVTGYEVYRDASYVETVTGVTYQDTAVSPSKSYAYKVRAVDGAGNKSDFTEEKTAVTPDLPDETPPAAPANLDAIAASQTQINLTWNAVTDPSGISEYVIYRNGSRIDTSTSDSYNDTGLSAGTNYCYRVSAVDGADNEGEKSVEKCATTPVTEDVYAPSVPANVEASALSSSQIQLSWEHATDNTGGTGVAGYRIYDADDMQIIFSVGYVNSAILNVVQAGMEYCITVSAVDWAGNESERSDPACATTPVVVLPPACTNLAGKSGVIAHEENGAFVTMPFIIGAQNEDAISNLRVALNENEIIAFNGSMAGYEMSLTANTSEEPIEVALTWNESCASASGEDAGGYAVHLRLSGIGSSPASFPLSGTRKITVLSNYVETEKVTMSFSHNAADSRFIFLKNYLGQIDGSGVMSGGALFFGNVYEEMSGWQYSAVRGTLEGGADEWQVNDGTWIDYSLEDLETGLSNGTWYSRMPGAAPNPAIPDVRGNWTLSFDNDQASGTMNIATQTNVGAESGSSAITGSGTLNVPGMDDFASAIDDAESWVGLYDGASNNIYVVSIIDMSSVGCGTITIASTGIGNTQSMSGTYVAVSDTNSDCDGSGTFTASRSSVK